jgi:hypothetical protein|tara:strand:+ start:261 stop:407 length:147 start_codon:yes stop_codon:yes gene_type:complete
MAKKAKILEPVKEKHKKVTSIGHSPRSVPKNKKKRVSWKRYKGQGKRR